MIHSATGEVKECDGEKVLSSSFQFQFQFSTEKYEKVFSGIKKEIETMNGGKEFMKETIVKLK